MVEVPAECLVDTDTDIVEMLRWWFGWDIRVIEGVVWRA